MTITQYARKTRFTMSLGASLGLAIFGSSCVGQPLDAAGSKVTGACFDNSSSVAPAKTDILIVKDTSSSMSDDNGRIADGMEAFVRALPTGFDYRVAVMMANAGNTEDREHLAKQPGDSFVLDSNGMNRDALLAQLRTKMMFVTDGERYHHEESEDDNEGEANCEEHPNHHRKIADNANGETGLYALHRIVQSGLYHEGQEHGLFRKDASLMVLFVSDNQDFCSSSAAATSPFCWMKTRAHHVGECQQDRDRDDRDADGERDSHWTPLTADRVFAELKGAAGDRLLSVSGILYSDSATVPAVLGKGRGRGYLDMIRLSSGAVFDLGAQSSLASIQSLASDMTVQGKGLSTLSLSYSATGIDASSIVVKVDGASVPFTLSSDGSQIQLGSPARPGDWVSLHYCQLPPAPVVTPSPAPSGTPAPSSTDTPAPSASPVPSSTPAPGTTPSTGTTCTSTTCGFVS